MKLIIPYVIILGLLFVCFYQWKNPEIVEVVKTETDTLTLWDTVYKEKPVPIAVTKIVKDTIYITDTVYVVLDRETKLYEDSTYQCQISGVNTELDWIKVFPKTTYITTEKVVQIEQKQPLFEFKPSVGLGYGLINNKIDIYVGGSLQINLNRKKQ